ncbi:MAG TPA: hypothetical protein VKH37_10485, partial [Ferruginibacter sp.]|nr:hypothetical protein [Ferruginibacter sp.]
RPLRQANCPYLLVKKLDHIIQGHTLKPWQVPMHAFTQKPCDGRQGDYFAAYSGQEGGLRFKVEC